MVRRRFILVVKFHYIHSVDHILMILIAMARFKLWLYVLNLCECRIYLTPIVEQEEWRCTNYVIEAFEVLKSMEKWLMAVQDASKSCKYFKIRIIDLLVFKKQEKFSNLIDIDSKCKKIIVFWSKMNFSVQGWGGVFLIAKSVSLLSWCTDFDLWKSFQSRLLRPNGRLRRNNETKCLIITIKGRSKP